MQDVVDLVVWLARVLSYAVLAYGATRFWKYRPKAAPRDIITVVQSWRAHILYFGGWLALVAYDLTLARGLALHQLVPLLAFAAIILGVIEFVGQRSARR